MKTIQFKDWDASAYQEIDEWIRKRPTMLCESNLTYHIIWNDYYKTKYCITEDGVLWIQFVKGLGHVAILPASDKEHLQNCIVALQQYFFNVLSEKMGIYLIDEEARGILYPTIKGYEWEEDEESSDYIYMAEELRKLSGRKYCKKKNMVSVFKRIYQFRYEYKRLFQKDRDSILIFLKEWERQKGNQDEFGRLEGERKGIACLLECVDMLKDVKMAGVFIDGVLKAFSIGVYDPTHKMAVIHVEKADATIRGLYAFLNQEFLIREFPEAVYVNREDDMGIDSLRRSKESYHPVFKTKKYTLKER